MEERAMRRLIVGLLASALAAPAAKDLLNSQTVSFVPNRGQTAAEVEFVSHGRHSSLQLSRGTAVLSLVRGGRPMTIELRLLGANPAPRVEGVQRLPGTMNYYLSPDSAGWRTGLPRFGRVLYHDVYPGIDLAYYGTARQLEYDFIVRPGADPRRIRMEVGGAAVRLEANGDLLLTAGGVRLRQHRPAVYQERDGRREPIRGRYRVHGAAVSFELGGYDPARTLVIDPLLGYSSYLGGNLEEDASGVAADSSSHVYLTGTTSSANFPLSPNSYRGVKDPGAGLVYVSKIEPDSEQLIYSAILGAGTSTGIAADTEGNAYVTGAQKGTFPVTYDLPAVGAGSYIAKLSPDGTKLVYAALLHGAANASGIAVDPAGAAYICGTTARTLPTTSAAYQRTFPGTSSSAGFVAKLNPAGNGFAYITYFGGPASPSTAFLNAIAVDAAGAAFLTGNTRTTDLAVTANAPQPRNAGGDDAFLFKLNPAGSGVSFGTYLGGVGGDWGRGVALDSTSQIVIAGHTTSGAFPATPGSYKTTVANFGGAGWVAKYAADGKLLFATYIADVTSLRGLALDPAGNAYVAGEAAFTSTLQTTPDAVKSRVDRNADGAQAWVGKLEAGGGRLLYGSYFGGGKDETCAGIAVDPDASAYISGETFSTDIPVSFDPVQRAKDPNLATRDAYVTQFAEPPWFDAGHVANAASFAGGAIAAGEIVTIYGFSLGPKVLKTYTISGGKLDSYLGRTRVTFDGVPAPVIYASWGQTSVVVPYAVAGRRTTEVVVEYKGRKSSPVVLDVADSAPGIFTAANTGSGQGAILLENFTVNSAANPVPKGRAAMVFLTVGGEAGVDGMLAPGIAQHPAPVTATIGGQPAQVLYAGPSPGLVWGLTQVNVIVPDTAPAGGAVPLVITFGGRSTQSGVTMAVR
jgi:uncharacterized protein (TIGR03437 family)